MHNARRYVRRPKLNSIPRSTIDASRHGNIDSTLKEFRACSQQLTPILSATENELRLLERLYYKGKNQHRSGLFWRKVEEMRRLGRRLLEVKLIDVVNDVRYGFFVDEGTDRQAKMLKGSWVQAPGPKFLAFVVARIRATLELVNKAHERFQRAHESFTLMMQTGAFLQLILALTAILSRLDANVLELQAVLKAFLASLERCLAELSQQAPSKRTRVTRPTLHELSTAPLESHTRDGVDEDLGKAAFRTDRSRVVQIETSRNTPPGMSEKNSQPGAYSSLITEQEETEGVDTADLQMTFVARSTIISTGSATPVTAHDTSAVAVATSSKATTHVITKTASDAASAKKVKKKRKKDAIDDIFSGL